MCIAILDAARGKDETGEKSDDNEGNNEGNFQLLRNALVGGGLREAMAGSVY